MSTKRKWATLALFLVAAVVGYILWTVVFSLTAASPEQSITPNSAQALLPAEPPPLQEAVSANNETALSPDVQKQLSILGEIFSSKNDNDPRMDNELRVLSDDAKSALIKMYQQLPLENRNERGTIVFLIGRNLNNKKDYQFLKEVLLEAPCLSLQNCFQNMPNNTDSHDHQDHTANSMAIVLDYPQLTALKALQKNKATKQELRALESDLLHMATSSRSRLVSELASEISSNRE
ncbi:hypothetical protein D3C87_123420 [compost metagenome]